MPRPKTYADADRVRILERAADVIADEGAAALSLRALASDAGVSTTAIYSLIGSKAEVLTAVAAEAARSFVATQQAAVKGDDAAGDLLRLGRAYREWAVAHPSLYAVMFHGLVPQPADGDPEQPDTFAPLLSVVSRLAEQGMVFGGDARRAALAIWATVHGAVSLELDLWPDQDGKESASAFETVLEAIGRAWLVGGVGAGT